MHLVRTISSLYVGGEFMELLIGKSAELFSCTSFWFRIFCTRRDFMKVVRTFLRAIILSPFLYLCIAVLVYIAQRWTYTRSCLWSGRRRTWCRCQQEVTSCNDDDEYEPCDGEDISTCVAPALSVASDLQDGNQDIIHWTCTNYVTRQSRIESQTAGLGNIQHWITINVPRNLKRK